MVNQATWDCLACLHPDRYLDGDGTLNEKAQGALCLACGVGVASVMRNV